MNMRDDLKAFIDNEISEEERTRILKEAENDPALQAEVIELRQISRALKEEAWQPQPVGLERTLRALEAAKGKRPWWLGPSFHWAVGGACTVMVAAILSPILANNGIGSQAEMATESLKASTGSPEMEGQGNVQDFSKQVQAQDKAAAPSAAKPEGNVVEVSPPAMAPQRPDIDGIEAPSVKESGGLRTYGGAPAQAPVLSPTFGSVTFDAGREAQTANVELEVDDVAKAQAKAKAIAKKLDGVATDKLKSDSQEVVASGGVTLRVPSAKFGEAVEQVRKLGTPQSLPLEKKEETWRGAVNGKPLPPQDAESRYADANPTPRKLAPRDNKVDGFSGGTTGGSGGFDGRSSLPMAGKVDKDNSTINLSLRERQKARDQDAMAGWKAPDESGRTQSVSKPVQPESEVKLDEVPTGNVFTFLFRYSPIWMPVILIAWWLARRKANRG